MTTPWCYGKVMMEVGDGEVVRRELNSPESRWLRLGYLMNIKGHDRR